MNLTGIIRKAANFPELSEEERKLLLDFRPENGASGNDSELEKERKLRAELEGNLQQLTNERDQAQKELSTLCFRQQIGKLAEKHKFSDPDYLEFLCARHGVSPDDETASGALIESLKQDSPKLFRLELKPGGGTPPSVNPNPIAPGRSDLVSLLNNAPEVQ